LSSRLQSQLQLPEYGGVDIELTLSNAGKVLQLKIVQAENQRNRSYIEKAILTISFPPFGRAFAGASQHTFRIALGNQL
jgi:hypothetical protein